MPVTQGREGDSPLDGVRVLVVAHHDVVREVIGRLLAAYGAEVVATSGAAEALRVLEREPADVVLSDIEMPGEDGFALIRKLRALPQERGGQTPAAALTGWRTVDDRARVLLAGFQYYLTKPINARMLVSVVATLAERSEAARKSRGRVPLGVSLGAK